MYSATPRAASNAPPAASSHETHAVTGVLKERTSFARWRQLHCVCEFHCALLEFSSRCHVIASERLLLLLERLATHRRVPRAAELVSRVRGGS